MLQRIALTVAFVVLAPWGAAPAHAQFRAGFSVGPRGPGFSFGTGGMGSGAGVGVYVGPQYGYRSGPYGYSYGHGYRYWDDPSYGVYRSPSGTYYRSGRVYRGDLGSTSRAEVSLPATSQDLQAPPPPTAEQATMLTDDELWMLLRDAVRVLEEELNGLGTESAGWKRHLEVAYLSKSFSQERGGPPDPAVRERLIQIVDAFDRVSQNPQYKSVSQFWGFRTLQVGLREYVLEPAQRARRQLPIATQAFQDALDGVSTGGGWKEFLKLGELAKLASESDLSSNEPRQRLEEIRKQFDKVVQNPDFAAVTRLRGFQHVHQALTQLVAGSPAAVPPPPKAE